MSTPNEFIRDQPVYYPIQNLKNILSIAVAAFLLSEEEKNVLASSITRRFYYWGHWISEINYLILGVHTVLRKRLKCRRATRVPGLRSIRNQIQACLSEEPLKNLSLSEKRARLRARKSRVRYICSNG